MEGTNIPDELTYHERLHAVIRNGAGTLIHDGTYRFNNTYAVHGSLCCVFLLFFFTYLRIMPLQYKLTVLALVYCFTILLPMLGIYLFQKINGWGIHGLSNRKQRFVPIPD